MGKIAFHPLGVWSTSARCSLLCSLPLHNSCLLSNDPRMLGPCCCGVVALSNAGCHRLRHRRATVVSGVAQQIVPQVDLAMDGAMGSATSCCDICYTFHGENSLCVLHVLWHGPRHGLCQKLLRQHCSVSNFLKLSSRVLHALCTDRAIRCAMDRVADCYDISAARQMRHGRR